MIENFVGFEWALLRGEFSPVPGTRALDCERTDAVQRPELDFLVLGYCRRRVGQ